MEELLFWLKKNEDLLQNLGILIGFGFSIYALWTEARARRIGNLMASTQQHRDIWKMIYEHPSLARVCDPKADLQATPLTDHEHQFASLLILHLAMVFRARSEGMFVALQGLRKDVATSFDLPVLRTVWEQVKTLQEPDFVEFVESCLDRRLG